MRRHYPDWLQAFVHYASIGEAPLHFYYWTGVATIAGALRRRVWIDQGFFRWLSNFYIILVAPPGVVAKSTTASIGMGLLRELKYIKFGPDVITWQALVKSLGEAAELTPIANGEFLPQSAVTIESSELGNLLNPNNVEMLDLLVSLWDGKATSSHGGGEFSKVTKTQGSDIIQNPWVNVLACTTPAWISGNFPEYTIGGGFTARCIFVYAERKRQLVAYPSESLPPEFQDIRRKLIVDLELISQIGGAYELTPDAMEWGENWYAEHHSRRPGHLDNDRFGGYLARKQTHMHKLAMIVAASKRDERVITIDDLQEALSLVSATEAAMPLVFSQIGRTEESKHTAELLSYIRSKGEIEYTELFREMFRVFPDTRIFEAALNSCRTAGYIESTPRGNKMIVRALR